MSAFSYLGSAVPSVHTVALGCCKQCILLGTGTLFRVEGTACLATAFLAPGSRYPADVPSATSCEVPGA